MSESHADTLISDDGTDPFPSVSQRRRRGVRVTTAAAVALGLALGGGAVAGAATSYTPPTGSPGHAGRPPFGGSPPAAVGTVKSVGTDTFTLTDQNGTAVTVDVGSTTTYRDPGVTSPTLASVTVGEHVAVFGTDSADTVTATSVAIGDPPKDGHGPGGAGGPGGPGGSPPAAVGTVKTVGTDTFTLTTTDGTTVTVNVGSTTTYHDPGVTSATFANVTVGEHVAVFGTDTANTVTATSVGVGNPPAGGPAGPAGPGGPGKGNGTWGGPPSSAGS